MNKITIAVIVLCIVAIAAGLVAWSVTRKSPRARMYRTNQ